MRAIEIFLTNFIDRGGYELTLEGLKNTVLIAVIGLLIGFILGGIIAVVKAIYLNSVAVRVIKAICGVYVAFMRGTPIIVQLLLGHYAIFPLLGINIGSLPEAIVIFGLNSGAYMSEIMRSGINSVDRGQSEAGRALGFSFSATMFRIVLPQAVKNVIPTIGNEFITLIKETSVLSFVAVVDLTRSMQAIADSTLEYFVPYIVLAAMYLILVLIITGIVKLVEKRYAVSEC
ncbi:MAG: amino acid ABC transporter permease [Clostridia bacterium]|nr:amino acid ABC transporter permease [Clostridia bacterium]